MPISCLTWTRNGCFIACLLFFVNCPDPITTGLLCRNDEDCERYRCIENFCGGPPESDPSKVVTACQKPKQGEHSCANNSQCCSNLCVKTDTLDTPRDQKIKFAQLCTCTNQSDCPSHQECCQFTPPFKTGYRRLGYFCISRTLAKSDIIGDFYRKNCIPPREKKGY